MANIIDSIYSGGMRVTNYTNEHLLLFNNTFESADFTNSDAYPTDLAIGTLMGRVSSTGKIVPLEYDASDGSQFPVGVLVANFTVPDGETKSLQMVTGGEINGNMLVLQTGTTLDSVIDGRRLRDRIASDTVGIVLRFPDELSKFDNQ